MNLRAVDIHAGYVPGIDILQGLSIEARDGEVTTVIGANGVGKSTFLKCAIGQLRPHTGTISFG
ncbi:MAG: ATP-binding cassette domain-containing protein, partial [Hyphomicrobiaceae bacterium]